MSEISSFEAGRQAALRGCYRVYLGDWDLPFAEWERQGREWNAGYDSVPAEQRGSGHLGGPAPFEKEAALI